jgi:hypothetical protein
MSIELEKQTVSKMPDAIEKLCVVVGMTDEQRNVARVAYLAGQVDGATSTVKEVITSMKDALYEA